MHNDICAKRLLSIDCGGNETRGVRHHRTVTKEHQINTSVNEINLPIHARSPTVTGQKHPATSLSYLCLFNVCSRFRCSAFFVFWQWSEGTKRRKRFIKVQNFAWLSRGTAFRGNRTWPAFDPGADPGGGRPPGSNAGLVFNSEYKIRDIRPFRHRLLFCHKFCEVHLSYSSEAVMRLDCLILLKSPPPLILLAGSAPGLTLQHWLHPPASDRFEHGHNISHTLYFSASCAGFRHFWRCIADFYGTQSKLEKTRSITVLKQQQQT